MQNVILGKDLLLGSAKAKELAGETYRNMHVPAGAFIIDEKKGPMLFIIGQDRDSHNPDALKVAVIHRGLQSAIVFYTHAVYVERYGKNGVRVTNADVHIADDIKVITRSDMAFTAHQPIITEWDLNDLENAAFRPGVE